MWKEILSTFKLLYITSLSFTMYALVDYLCINIHRIVEVIFLILQIFLIKFGLKKKIVTQTGWQILGGSMTSGGSFHYKSHFLNRLCTYTACACVGMHTHLYILGSWEHTCKCQFSIWFLILWLKMYSKMITIASTFSFEWSVTYTGRLPLLCIVVLETTSMHCGSNIMSDL